jgi:hypothetical protein
MGSFLASGVLKRERKHLYSWPGIRLDSKAPIRRAPAVIEKASSADLARFNYEVGAAFDGEFDIDSGRANDLCRTAISAK